MPAGYGYVVRLAPTALTTALTLVQVKAGSAAGLFILSARVYQVTKTSTELLKVQVLRKTGAATVTSFTPLKLNSGDPSALCVGGTSATGITATNEGTDGDILAETVWNILNGEWLYLPVPEERIWVPAAGIAAVKLATAPAASMSVGCDLHILEMQ
jgi:predicted RecA/RadA family phage recombinase